MDYNHLTAKESKLKKSLKEYLFLIPVSGTIIVLDQFTKFLVRSNLAQGEVWSPWQWLLPYARIVHWYNTGVAFGLLQGQNWFFAILAVIIASAIVYLYPRFSKEDWPLRLALALQFGGAVGNLIDRILVGHVTDFISVGNFAVFNIADASITMGVLAMIVGIWWKDHQDERSKKKDHQMTEKQEVDSILSTKK
jgi:signal peptidase II